jgi:hypothetical protein
MRKKCFKERMLDFFFKEYYSKMWASWLEEVKKIAAEIGTVRIPKELPKYEPNETVFPDPSLWYSTGYQLVEAFTSW